MRKSNSTLPLQEAFKVFAIVCAILISILGLTLVLHFREKKQRPVSVSYVERPEGKLFLYQYRPRNWSSGQQNICVVFFFGGGWEAGSPFQFHKHARHLAKHGYVAITVDYRTKRKHGTTPFESVADAQTAMRWIREHSLELGINPDQIIAASGSSGGQLAASCATFPVEDSCRPNGLILMGAALDLDIPYIKNKISEGQMVKLLTISPLHRLSPESQFPRTLALHGEKDPIIPLATIRTFEQKVEQDRNSNLFQLIEYTGRGHEFYLATEPDYRKIMARIISFLDGN